MAHLTWLVTGNELRQGKSSHGPGNRAGAAFMRSIGVVMHASLTHMSKQT